MWNFEEKSGMSISKVGQNLTSKDQIAFAYGENDCSFGDRVLDILRWTLTHLVPTESSTSAYSKYGHGMMSCYSLSFINSSETCVSLCKSSPRRVNSLVAYQDTWSKYVFTIGQLRRGPPCLQATYVLYYGDRCSSGACLHATRVSWLLLSTEMLQFPALLDCFFSKLR